MPVMHSKSVTWLPNGGYSLAGWCSLPCHWQVGTARK